jgi:virginiamycin B lyase
MRTRALAVFVPALWWTTPAPAGNGAREASSASDPVKVEITEWKVPWEKSRPRDPFLDGKNRVWFVGQTGNYVAYLDPTTGQFKRFEVDADAHPHNLIIDKAGTVWYSGNTNGKIYKMDPVTGKSIGYPMPDPTAKDPHTLVFDNKGDLWFTVQSGNFVGKLTAATGHVQLIKMTTPRARPYGIVIDSKNRPWFDLFGTNKLGTVDPATMQLKEYTLPDSALPRRIALTSDDVLWYGDYRRGTLGRLDPATGAVREFPLPSKGTSLPYAMAADDRDRLWLVETGVQPNRLVGFDPKGGTFFSITDIKESGAGTVRHMVFHKPSRTLWFGTDANTIGRAKVP